MGFLVAAMLPRFAEVATSERDYPNETADWACAIARFRSGDV